MLVIVAICIFFVLCIFFFTVFLFVFKLLHLNAISWQIKAYLLTTDACEVHNRRQTYLLYESFLHIVVVVFVFSLLYNTETVEKQQQQKQCNRKPVVTDR